MTHFFFPQVEFLEQQQYSNGILVQDKEAKVAELDYSLQMMNQENNRLQQEILNLKALVNDLRAKNQKVQQDFESSQREVMQVRQTLVKIETKYETVEESRNKQVMRWISSYWASRENSLELIELSSINIVSLVLV